MAVTAAAGMAGAQAAADAAGPEGNAGTVEARKLRVVVCYGVYTDGYRLDGALTGYDLTLANALPAGIRDLPEGTNWAGVSLLVLSDVSGAEFSSNQVREIRAFVADGGGLLTLGGPFTYGLGAFKAKGIEELLPVEGAPFDLTWEPRGAALTPQARAHRVLDGVGFAAHPVTYWFHRETLKPGAEVLIRAGEQPLLIAGTYGRGRVLCFTGTPLGKPGRGERPFWTWEEWPRLVSNMAAWLGAGRSATEGRAQP